jgi:hypothetical protein
MGWSGQNLERFAISLNGTRGRILDFGNLATSTRGRVVGFGNLQRIIVRGRHGVAHLVRITRACVMESSRIEG